MRKKRKNFTPTEKISIVKKHLLENVPVSDLCDEYTIHPTLFYRWQKTLFEKGNAAFHNENKRHINQLEEQIDTLKSRISGKDEVIAELLGEHLSLKKKLGDH